MTDALVPEKKVKKLPACDSCKARRVLCHPQPNGEPCPRCIEKNVLCTTTPIQRGRPRKRPLPEPKKSASSSAPSQDPVKLEPQPTAILLHGSMNCPELSPEFVAHCFEGEAMKYTKQYDHPLIEATGIFEAIKTHSYQLHLLSPQLRVLALCIICAASLASFHPCVLGDDPAHPRPKSFMDHDFFFASTSRAAVLDCGIRRAPVFRALREEALKAAWETGVLLQPSNENAASCYLLDLFEQYEFCGNARPWGVAYVAHIRVLAPVKIAAGGYSTTEAIKWAGFIMNEVLISTRKRTPLLITPNDQLMLAGPEPQTLEALLTSLEKASGNPSYSLIWTTTKPFMYHVVTLARQLSETIAGDYARLEPLSEAAVLNFMTPLSIMQSLVSTLLERVDAAIAAGPLGSSGEAGAPDTLTVLDGSNIDVLVRGSAYAIASGFAGLVNALYQELRFRLENEGVDATTDDHDERRRDRLRLLQVQVHQMAVGASRALARVLRYLPKVHYAPLHWLSIYKWAEFCADEADASGNISREDALDLETFAQELKLLGYCLEASSTPQAIALMDRIDQQVHRARAPAHFGFYDSPSLGDVYLPPSRGNWMGRQPYQR